MALMGGRLKAATCAFIFMAALGGAFAQERAGNLAARKFDEFQPRYLEDFELRLLHFLHEGLLKDPHAQGYVIGYDGRRTRLRDTMFNLARVKNRLGEAEGVPAGRIVTVEGGSRARPTLEFWLVPEGATPPEATPVVQSQRPLPVSIIQLIANPTRYQGRLVGFVSIKFEGKDVYLHEDDYRQGITQNGLWLDLPGSKSGSEHAQYHERYVLIEGVFDATRKGHMGAFNGTLKNIQRMQVT